MAGLSALLLGLLSAVLARGCLRFQDQDCWHDYLPRLLLRGAWAGIGLAENLGLLLVFLNLFLFVVDRWLRRKGLGWRFLVLRDDWQD